MDVSDIKLLQTIYYILASSVSIRKNMSLNEFKTYVLSELRSRSIKIDLIDEKLPLYAANNHVVLYFPENNENENQVMIILMQITIHFSKTYVIAYAIQNNPGACVIRFELPEGFVSSHEKGE